MNIAIPICISLFGVIIILVGIDKKLAEIVKLLETKS